MDLLPFLTDFKPDIIQIAAQYDDVTFCRYVVPERGYIPRFITDLTGISFKDGNMFSNGVKVTCCNKESALREFIDFLPENSLLCAHNGFKFDVPILIQDMRDCDLLNTMQGKVKGLLDTLLLAKETYPDRTGKGKGGHSQEGLVKDILNETYAAHNALDDVKALSKLYTKMKVGNSEYMKNTWSFEFAVRKLDYQIKTSKNLRTFDCLVADKILSEAMARKAAGSGLCMKHLKTAASRNGIKELFSERASNNKPRVTLSKLIIDRVQKHVKTLK